MFGFRRTCRGQIGGDQHPVDAAERPVLGQTVPGIEHHVLAVVQRILVKLRLGMCFPAALFSSEDGSTTRSVLDVIRHGGVPCAHGEIEHDVIAGLMRMRVQIPRKRFVEKAFRSPKHRTSAISCPHFDRRAGLPKQCTTLCSPIFGFKSNSVVCQDASSRLVFVRYPTS